MTLCCVAGILSLSALAYGIPGNAGKTAPGNTDHKLSNDDAHITVNVNTA
jgi:hypothetical protein